MLAHVTLRNHPVQVPFTREGVVQHFQANGGTGNVYVLHVRHTSYDDDNDITEVTILFIQLTVINGRVQQNDMLGCYDFNITGDQLYSLNITDIEDVLITIRDGDPMYEAAPSTPDVDPEEVYTGFYTGFTCHEDYCYDGAYFNEAEHSMIIYSTWNLNNNLIKY